jgi:DNA-binding winged helix-turn-helix (wHTH) protein/tetratricopeptide (TPR) repeat protein
MQMTERQYRFGPFSVIAATRELRRGEALVDLPARAFDCLVYLIEHRDRAVGRDELISAVWGRADVSEALLNHTILKIRRALGEGGSGQQAIRTVPRFGYRWVGDVDVLSAQSSQAESAAPLVEQRNELAPNGASVAVAAPDLLWSRARIALLALGAAAILIVLVVVAMRRLSPVAPVAVSDPVVAGADVAEQTAMPALVLPAQVDAPADWSWLRFGVMDLVANRLRNGALRTMPSESVVGLLRQRASADGDALLRDPALASVAALRVLPRVRRVGERWSVQLDAMGAQRALQVDAESADPVEAAKDATDQLLRKLGHVPDMSGTAGSSRELDDLLQRSGAAMLADQLTQARDLIARAPPALHGAPRVEQRMAQIELRAGEYDAVERRLLTLLDRLTPQQDGALRARALITLASSYVRRNQFDKADEAYAEAIALRGDAKDPEVLGIAYLGRGIVLSQKGRFDEAFAELGRARIELETAGDPLGVAQVDVNLGDFQLIRHRPADALPMLKTAAQRFEQLGAREGLVYALIGVAGAQRDLLDPAAALATTDRYWPAQSSTNNPRMQWMATRARAEALAGNGRLGDAQALVERIRTQSDPQRDAALRVQNEAVAAHLSALRGEPPEAARVADGALTPMLRDSDKTLYARTLLLRARAARSAGAIGKTDEPGRQLRDMATAEGDDWFVLYATLADAEQAWAEERRDAALQGFAAALQRAEKLNIPEEIVAVAAPYIDALIEVGHLDDAQSVSGRIAPWADRDLRAAWAQVRLFRALGRADAERNARAVAVRLAGDGPLPKPVNDEGTR